MADWMVWDSGAFTADVVTMLTTEDSVELTDHPVELGAVITDHTIRRPATVTFEFAQSAQPFREPDVEWTTQSVEAEPNRFTPGGLLAITMAVGSALSAGLSAVGLGGAKDQVRTMVLTAKSEENRIQSVHDTLVGLLGTTEVTFTYQGLVLPGYYLTRVSRTQQGGSGGLARFSVEARPVIKVATLQTSALGALPTPSLLDALPNLDLGPKGKQAVVSSVESHSVSLGVDPWGGWQGQ